MAAAEQMAAEVAGQSETEGEAEPTVQIENADVDQVGEPEKKKQRTWMRTDENVTDLSGYSQTWFQFQKATSMKWNEKEYLYQSLKTKEKELLFINYKYGLRNWWFGTKFTFFSKNLFLSV